VPVAAGMGGGSGDAAAALRLAARAAGRPGDPVLAELAPRLGADVPSQVAPARAFVTGAGERVEALPGPPGPFGLLVLPSAEALSTPAVYREADRLGLGRPPAELDALARTVRAAAGALPAGLRHNDLEAAARSMAPSIGPALDAIRAAGAGHAMVSGSGPTVFGVFEARTARSAPARRVRPGGRDRRRARRARLRPPRPA
jgi:4-diphosphocytidyl-2-C-methyl-D-erythritol kinase